MARKNYTDEFRQRAVDLYESTPGSTLKGIAGDLGISRGALKEWVDKFGSGVTVAAASPPGATGRPESQAAKVLRLEADLAALQAEARKLEIPVIAITDTNCNPDIIDFVIPGNDDAIKSIRLFTAALADAAIDGAASGRTDAAVDLLLNAIHDA